jgi:type II secretory pathway pseudopilin PulG
VNRGRRRCQSGFTLIELAVLMVILGMVLLVAAIAVPSLSERTRLDSTSLTIGEVAGMLASFAAVEGRLPCPDTSAIPNGLEGSGAGSLCVDADVVGRVPYRDVGIADPVLDEAHLPVRYAVYRDPAAMADLAALPNRFIPVLPGDPATLTSYTGLGAGNPEVVVPTKGINPTRVMPDVKNDLDFCLALRTAKTAVASTSRVHTLDLGGATPSFNAAFVLVSGGVEDADGDGTDQTFDGVNEGGGLGFESPARRRSGNVYDDLVFAMPFELLESKMSCAAITIAVTSAANVAIAAAHALVQAEDAVWSGKLSVTMGEISVASAAVAVLMGAIAIWAAANDVTLGAAGCLALFPDNCAALPFAVIGLAAAVVSEAAAIATVVLTALALVEANEALDIAICTVAGCTATPPPVLLDPTVPGVYDHAQKTRMDAVAADARGGQT